MQIDLAVQCLWLGNWQWGSNCAVYLGVAIELVSILPPRSIVDSSCHDIKTIQTAGTLCYNRPQKHNRWSSKYCSAISRDVSCMNMLIALIESLHRWIIHSCARFGSEVSRDPARHSPGRWNWMECQHELTWIDMLTLTLAANAQRLTTLMKFLTLQQMIFRPWIHQIKWSRPAVTLDVQLKKGLKVQESRSITPKKPGKSPRKIWEQKVYVINSGLSFTQFRMQHGSGCCISTLPYECGLFASSLVKDA